LVVQMEASEDSAYTNRLLWVRRQRDTGAPG
jgi:hypothetical protein